MTTRCTNRVAPGRLLALVIAAAMIVAGMPAQAAASTGGSGTWAPTTSSPVSNRYWHTATTLPDGRVLSAGGHFPESYVATYRTEVYMPATDSWASTPRMNVPRERHTATLLQEPGCGSRCGQVLVTGGAQEVDPPTSDAAGPAAGSAELYDPVLNQWLPTGPLTDLRANHTATLLADGTVLVAGGNAANAEGFVEVAADSAETFDPVTGTFIPTDGYMTRARADHTATLLPNGKVLLAGRVPGPADPTGSSAEVYDPATRAFSAARPLGVGRSNHTATLLPDGKVLVTGGDGGGSSAELYDYTTGTWAGTGHMSVARADHTATLLPSGEVLVAGGSDSTLTELYNPTTGQWRPAGDLRTPHRSHTATLLPTGNVLAIGGSCTFFSQQHLTCPWAEVWTASAAPTAPAAPTGVTAIAGNASATVSWAAPASDGGSPITSYTVTSSPGAVTATVDGSTNTATVSGLTNGVTYTFTVSATNAVGTGPASEPSNAVTPTAVAGPGAPTGVTATAGDASATVSWTAPASDGGSPITSYTVTSSPGAVTASVDGSTNTATVSGLTNGVTYTFTVRATNAVGTSPPSEPSNAVTPMPADPTVWSAAGDLGVARSRHTATLLGTGKVLVTGGLDAAGRASASAELFDPATGSWSPTGSLAFARTRHTATLLENGKVLVAGGLREQDSLDDNAGNLALNVAELYDPATGVWSVTGAMAASRYDHTATRLANGKVLVAGGKVSNTTSAAAELYDPLTGTWAATGPLDLIRTEHSATLLPDGTVLIAGGQTQPFPTNSNTVDIPYAEVYDPATGISRPTGSLNRSRSRHTATLLGDGKVLVAGGGRTPTASAELYDWTTRSFRVTGALATARTAHTATVLPNGDVLVVGGTGCSANCPLASAELYRPSTATWTQIAGLQQGRRNHTGTTLPDGRVLAAGGEGADGTLRSSEVYARAAAPEAPTGVTAVAGNASATVSWTAPASDGGSPVTSYTVTSSPGGVTASVGATSTTATVTGLTNGVTYTFTVAATNAAGTGPASAPSNAVTPMGVPGAPTGVTAVAGNASATVSWTAPASDGGSPVTSYTVTSSPGGTTVTVSGSATTATVTGLTNGISHTFTVTATNSVGTGPASAPSNAVTPTKKKR